MKYNRFTLQYNNAKLMSKMQSILFAAVEEILPQRPIWINYKYRCDSLNTQRKVVEFDVS
jgi:hypothetical protein